MIIVSARSGIIFAGKTSAIATTSGDMKYHLIVTTKECIASWPPNIITKRKLMNMITQKVFHGSEGEGLLPEGIVVCMDGISDIPLIEC